MKTIKKKIKDEAAKIARAKERVEARNNRKLRALEQALEIQASNEVDKEEKLETIFKAKIERKHRLDAKHKAVEKTAKIKPSKKVIAKNLLGLFGKDIKLEQARRKKQSSQDKATFKAKQAEWKAQYVPTGNTESNPAFIGPCNIFIRDKSHNKEARKERRLAKRQFQKEKGLSKFKIRMQMQLAKKQEQMKKLNNAA